MHHQDAIAHVQELRQVGRDHDRRPPLLRQIFDEAEHLGLRPHVYAAGGLVEEQHPRPGLEPPGDDHLLLVATGEHLHPAPDRGRPYVQLVPAAPGDPALLRQVYEPEAGRQMGQRDVLVHPELERQALALAVLGKVADASIYRVLRPSDVQLSSIELDGSRIYAVGPEDCPGQLGAAGPDEAGEAQDLPGAHLEGAVLEDVAAGDPFGAGTTSPISTSVLG